MKGYVASIEPEIYQKLNWNHDLIVKCLEVIRLELPKILFESSPDVQYDLVAVGNPFGPPYPAIGLYDPQLEIKIDWMEINEKVNQWVQQVGLHDIINKAANIYYIDWGKLSMITAFPP